VLCSCWVSRSVSWPWKASPFEVKVDSGKRYRTPFRA
jgi:hypothetical protein